MNRIYVIRHATPDWERKDLAYHLPPGPPLTEQGLSEAQALGEFLGEAGVKRLYTSPLERCQTTARIAAEINGMPWRVADGLIEWQPNDDRTAVLARVWPVFEQALQEAEVEGPVGLVTHGAPICVLLLALGMGEDTLLAQRRYDHSNPAPPGGAWLAERSRDRGHWALSLAFAPG